MPVEAFRYPTDIASTLAPWRHKLGLDFESVVARLADRDRVLENNLSVWLQRYAFRGYPGANFTANNNAFTTIPLDNTVYTDMIGLLSSNAYVVPADGLYHIAGKVTINTGGQTFTRLILTIFINGTEVSRGPDHVEPTANTQTWGTIVSDDLHCTKGDLITLRVFQENGSAANLTAIGGLVAGHAITCWGSFRRIGPFATVAT